MSLQYPVLLEELRLLTDLNVRLPSVEEAVRRAEELTKRRDAIRSTPLASTRQRLADALAKDSLSVDDAVKQYGEATQQAAEDAIAQGLLQAAVQTARAIATSAFTGEAEALVGKLRVVFDEALDGRDFDAVIEVWGLHERMHRAGLLHWRLQPLPSVSETRYHFPERLPSDISRTDAVAALMAAIQANAEPWLPTPGEVQLARQQRGDASLTTSAPGRRRVSLIG